MGVSSGGCSAFYWETQIQAQEAFVGICRKYSSGCWISWCWFGTINTQISGGSLMLLRGHRHSDLLTPAVLPCWLQFGYLLAGGCRARLSLPALWSRDQKFPAAGAFMWLPVLHKPCSSRRVLPCPPTQSAQASQMLFLWMCTSGFTLLPREVLLYILCVVAAFPASQELGQREGILQVLQKQAHFSHSSHTTSWLHGMTSHRTEVCTCMCLAALTEMHRASVPFV